MREESVERSNLSHTTFILIGFPELYEYRRLLFFPFFLIYVVVLIGNSVIIYVIKTAESLHTPMYILISYMAVIDIIVPTAIIPNMLLSLLFDWNRISLAGCLTQMFFVHCISSFESTILLIMALDRYVAICNPLRYAEIMNTSVFLKMGIFSVIRGGAWTCALIILAHPLSFCGSNIINQCYCEHMALVSLACGSTTKNNVTGLLMAFTIVGFDISCILFSYIRIITVVIKTASAKERQKAFHTCSTHLIVMFFFYISGNVSFVTYRVSNTIPTDVHTLLSVMYLVVPASVNPIIYGVRTKEIRQVIVKMFRRRRILVSSNVVTVKT
ncbi:olfactory receptor 51E2-like [Acipenser ruthenus]|uniref:olfactory receptor 51E2-like n=1 Tax=Acipenser ruthenus TaxID=7906 RepID=UPI002740BF6F|nr:olfactory receptor 51E2-like [Acipenser ruthenus]